jgi:hypothetical protein
MATGSLYVSDWLRTFEDRAQRFVHDERPDSLVEFEVDLAERQTLYREVGKSFPWSIAAECVAAVTVAAVQAAADAEEGDEAYIGHFLHRIGRADERSAWDNEYGPATERFFERHFQHKRKSGPWRYVRTVFMHAGIVLAGIRAYAEMLDGLLSRGAEFTYQEHLASARRVSSTLIRPFLLTQTGFKFSRTTAQYLRRHQRGELSLNGLEALRGYRSGFWPELLNHLTRDVGVKRSEEAPKPRLALDPERCSVVLRFAAEWQSKGTYRVEGHAVTYPDQRVAGRRPTRVQVGNRPPAEVSPWWGPGMSPVAVFRAGDGQFLGAASPGGKQPWTLRGGTCFIVAEQSLASELEKLQALPLGVLDVLPQDDGEPAYDIWQAELRPATVYPNLGLRTVGREALPSLAFADTAARHTFGRAVFLGTLPELKVTNWTEETRSRYAIRLAWNGDERELDVPTGVRSYKLPLTEPCQGRVWIEPRGYSSSADALAGADFTLLPADFSVNAEDSWLTEHDKGTVVARLPHGWTLRALTPGVVRAGEQTWRTPPGTRVVDALVLAPNFTLPLSLRLPVVSLSSRSGAQIIWVEEIRQGTTVECDLEGPPQALCDVTLADHQHTVTLISGVRLGGEGSCRLRMRAFLDAIDGSQMPLGRVGLRLAGHALATGVWIGSFQRLAAAVSPWETVPLHEEFASGVPAIGSAIAALMRLRQRPLENLTVSPLIKTIAAVLPSVPPAALSAAVADCASLAEALDGTVHDCPANLQPSDDAAALIEFWSGTNAAAPEALSRLSVQRWRERLERARDERNDEAEAGELLEEWRCALLSGEPCRLATRAGGYHLTEGARRLCQAAAQPAGKARNQLLTTVLASLDEAIAAAPSGTTVRTVAEISRQLALMNSGRELEPERIATLDSPSVLVAAISSLRELAQLPAISAAASSGIGLMDLLPSVVTAARDERGRLKDDR